MWNVSQILSLYESEQKLWPHRRLPFSVIYVLVVHFCISVQPCHRHTFSINFQKCLKRSEKANTEILNETRKKLAPNWSTKNIAL